MKKEKGITLIALIITIIILLILAVVTIGSIKNSNIISYAENASTNYETSKADEQDVLSKYEDLISVGVYKETGPLGEARNKENYGKKVIGFQSKGEGLEDIVWRVFYQDDKNVYLISERVDSEGQKQYPLLAPALYIASTIIDEEGNAFTKEEKGEILEKYNNGSDVSKQGQDLMKKAKEANIFTKENINKNIIVTAYMCDIGAWEDYTDAEGKAVWAMGGPTVELYEKSFNYVMGDSSAISCNIEGNGYIITQPDEEYITTDYNDIYRLGGNPKIGAWHLVAPINRDTKFNNTNEKLIAIVSNLYGYIKCDRTVTNALMEEEKVTDYTGFGMRPIVCIPVANFDYELE